MIFQNEKAFMIKNKKNQIFGTKAETLANLSELRYNVPLVYYFSVKKWNKSSFHKTKLFSKRFSNY